MGRNAKLRRERKLPSSNSTQEKIKHQDNSILARASDLVKKPLTSPEKQLSWSDKFWFYRTYCVRIVNIFFDE